MDDLTRVLALHSTAGTCSNKDILIGTLLRSIAEPSGTDNAVTLGLALARRADSIVGHGIGKS